MKVDLQELQLSGKGFLSESEWLDDNMRIITSGVPFHEVVMNDVHIGWIIMGEFRLDADFTAHSKSGMKGESVSDRIEYAFIYDKDYDFKYFVPTELTDLPTEEAQVVLDKYKAKGDKNVNIHSGSNGDEENQLVIISTKTKYVLLQSPKQSIRVAEGDVMVLDRVKDKLLQVSSKKGHVSVQGDDSNIEINGGRIMINDKELNPGEIVSDVMKNLSRSFSGIFRNNW